MATPLAICDQTGRPIPPGDAPKGKWLRCWFCENARVQRRTSVKGNVFYSTYRGDEHTHPVCASERTANKSLEFEDMSYTFHTAMVRELHHGDGGPRGGGHNPPDDGDETISVEKLTSLAGLVKWGLFVSPDFQLNKQDHLSDILLNSAIAQTYFSAGPIRRLGPRAIVAKPDAFDENQMWFRFALDYSSDAEGAKKRIYFYQITTLRQLFEIIKDKLFCQNENMSGYIPKDNLTVIIYGDWNAYGCNRCKIRSPKTECADKSCCAKFIYESLYTKYNFVYTKKKNQSLCSEGE